MKAQVYLENNSLVKVVSTLLLQKECDAMAVYEIFDKKWASVSIKAWCSGAVRDIRDSIEFVESFDNVIFVLIMTNMVEKQHVRLHVL